MDISPSSKTNKTYDLIDTPLKNPDGSISKLEIFRDITKRKEMEEKIKAEKERAEHYLDIAGVIILALNEKGEISLINKKGCEVLHYEDENELIGKNWFEYCLPPSYRVRVFQYFKQLMNGESEIIPFYENPVITKLGDEKLITWSTVLVKDSEGNATGVISSGEDITKRKKAERELRESREKYRNAYNRSNLYKDVFTHDINNILQNILSSLELTKIFSSDPKKRQSFEEVTNLIYEQVIRGKMLVSNVQELSKTDEITSSLFSIKALKVLKDSLESVKSQFNQKGIDIKIDSLQDDYFVKANELLKDVFVNILTNAIQHNTNPFIEISIKISKENYRGIQFIKFEFLDNGIGIPDSMKQLIFSREFKKEGIPSGIGLGLLLVKRILESYKGEIRVEDRIKGNFTKGCNFIISIPEAI